MPEAIEFLKLMLILITILATLGFINRTTEIKKRLKRKKMNFYTSIELALWVIAISSVIRTGLLIWRKK